MAPPVRPTVDVPAEALFRAVRERDDAALAEFVRRLTPWLTGEVRRAGARGSEVEEVVQDTWIAAIGAADEIGDDLRLLPWLATVARNRLVTLRRSERRRERLHAARGDGAGAVPDVIALVRGREALVAVRHAVENLPAPYRDVVRLHLFEGMAPREIARRLGLGRVGVRARLFRGLRLLRRSLPDALALVLLATLARRGSTQAPLWIGGVALAAATTALVLVPATPTAGLSPAAPVPSPVVAADVEPDGGGEPAAASPPRWRVSDVRVLRVRVVDAAGDGVPGVGVKLGPPGGFDPLLHDRIARTGHDGVTTFAGVLAGELHVGCDRGAVAVAAPSDELVQLRIGGGLEVRGRVVDAVGSPVATARVWLVGPGRPSNEGCEVATVQPDGTFELRAVVVGSSLAIRAAGHAGLAPRVVDRGDLGTLVLRDRGGAAAIEVIGPDGGPVAGAGLVLGRVEAEVSGPTTPPTRLPPFVAHTDERGRCSFQGIEPGYVPLLVRAPGAAPTITMVRVAADAETPVQVRLTAGATLRGRVVDALGRGISAARLACRSDTAFAAVDALTDTNGGFRLESLPVGDIGLLAWAPQCDVVERVLALAPGDTDVVVEVVQRVRRRGRLVDPSDRPLVGWRLALPLTAARSVQANSTATTSDADGWVECVVGPGADWRGMLIQPPGAIYWAKAEDLLEDLPDGSFLVRASADMLAAARVDGRVLTAEGLPLRAATIAAYDGFGNREVIGTTDADGRFVYAALTAGEYRLVVEARNGDTPTVELPRFQVDPGEHEVLEVSAPAAGQVTFDLRFANGARPQFPQVKLVHRHSLCTHAVHRVAVGRQSLVPGDYIITVFGDDLVARTERFVVAAGMRTEVAMTVEPAAPREFVFRRLPVPDVGNELTGTFVDAVSGVPLGSFRLAMDQAFPLPLTCVLPAGVIRCDLRTATGYRLSATFELQDLVPSCAAQTLRFHRVE